MHHVKFALDVTDRVPVGRTLRNSRVTDYALPAGTVDAVDADTQNISHDFGNKARVEISTAAGGKGNKHCKWLLLRPGRSCGRGTYAAERERANHERNN